MNQLTEFSPAYEVTFLSHFTDKVTETQRLNNQSTKLVFEPQLSGSGLWALNPYCTCACEKKCTLRFTMTVKFPPSRAGPTPSGELSTFACFHVPYSWFNPLYLGFCSTPSTENFSGKEHWWPLGCQTQKTPFALYLAWPLNCTWPFGSHLLWNFVPIFIQCQGSRFLLLLLCLYFPIFFLLTP